MEIAAWNRGHRQQHTSDRPGAETATTLSRNQKVVMNELIRYDRERIRRLCNHQAGVTPWGEPPFGNFS